MTKRYSAYGAVVTAVVSPGPVHQIILVKVEGGDAWKLPGGGIEEGESVIDAAVRETMEEAGELTLKPEQVTQISSEIRRGTHYTPNICLAQVDWETFGRHLNFGDENGKMTAVKTFTLSGALKLPDLLERHREYLTRIASILAAQAANEDTRLRA